jgi:hypothetical protein
MFNKLFYELTDEQQELPRGGASFGSLSGIVAEKVPGASLPSILTSPHVEEEIETATNNLLQSHLSSML